MHLTNVFNVLDWEIQRHHQDGFVDSLEYTCYASSGNLKGITLINLPKESQVSYNSSQGDFKVSFQSCKINMGFPFTPFHFSSVQNVNVLFENCSADFWKNGIELQSEDRQGTLHLTFTSSTPTFSFIQKALEKWNGKDLIVDGDLSGECQSAIENWKKEKVYPLSIMINNLSV